MRQTQNLCYNHECQKSDCFINIAQKKVCKTRNEERKKKFYETDRQARQA